MFKEKYQISPKKSDSELSLFIQLAITMSESTANLCSSLKGANMALGDVCNINRNVRPCNIQSWIMLMQVWGSSFERQPHQDLKRCRLRAHQKLTSAQGYVDVCKENIRKLLLSHGVKCDIDLDQQGNQIERHKLLKALSEI